ncbi:MAG: ABC transporter substrate-binding protein [Acidimicrobiales bacterium]|nr:ABC transporter substrate-binding protein [Acidimicrobiales bacterium]MYB80749.1 ABC transporter substrate-binding protein [Acidimicrobiales bacterium]MYI11213.1 ABC transporter substrate-binding protein [Acidimicrobiales bacterium]
MKSEACCIEFLHIRCPPAADSDPQQTGDLDMTRSRLRAPRRRIAQFAAAMAAAVLLAASCTGGEADDGAADGFDGTVRIGAALSETGRFAAEGKAVRQGYETWLRWVNEDQGGIRVGDDRYRAEIVYRDDQSDPDRIGDLIEQLIDEDQVDFLLGPYSSTLTGPASAAAETHGAIMVEGNGASDGLFERGYRNLFYVGVVASDYTRSSIELLAEQGARTAVVAYEDTPFATSVAEGAQRHLEANGVEVLAMKRYPVGVDNVDDLMTQLAALGPDIFVGGGHYDDAMLFLRSAQEQDFRADAMLITVGPANPQLLADVGSGAEGVLGPTPWEPVMAYEDASFGTASAYADTYESLWGESPIYQAAGSTTAALALHRAIEAAGSLDTDAVRDALRELDIDTFYGPIRFDERGVNVAKPMGTVQVQDGRIVVVAPAAAAEGELVYPAR